jgi:hypothetical protein
VSSVNLRAFTAEDGAWLDTWLPSVAQVVGYETGTSAALRRRLRAEKKLRARVIERDREAAGLVVYKLNSPTLGSAWFELVATPVEHSRKGAGMTAAALAEGEMIEGGARTIYAPSTAAHGISVYFWIRLGYAPLLRTEWPCEREGVAWLRRIVAQRVR